MRFDRIIFFEQYRRHFGAIPAGKQYVVEGLERLLTGFETYWGWWDDLRQIANALAQVGWETAWSYTPVEEGYYLGDPNRPGYFDGENSAAVKRLQKSFRYYPHFGRGDIQLTWAENYADQDKRIRKWFPERVAEFEQRTGKKFDLIGDPDQATDPWISFCIFTIGMHLGTFRAGHNLDRYITPTKTDHFGARNIVNGDRNYLKRGKKIGTHIKETAERFVAVLEAALLPEDPPKPADPEIEPLAPETIPPVHPPIPVALPDTETIGDAAPEPSLVTAAETAPAGDQPMVPAKGWLTVEDWKPLVKRWLLRIWGFNIPANVTQFSGLGFAAISDPPNWMIYLGIALVLFVLLGGAAILVSAVLLGIWYFNRKEIKDAKELEATIKADPELKNIDVVIEKK
jgi:hypothetical protein